MRPATLLALTAALAVFAGRAEAQERPRPRPSGPAGFAVVSPEVHEDGRVTFRIRAPEAGSVIVARDGAPRLPMEKGEQGVWSVTTDALDPDIYPYTFIVDGLTIADPGNPLVKPIVMGGNQSLVHVPGPKELTWEENDVPRGTIHEHFYKSDSVGETRGFYVYTPPGYDPAGNTEYPVLYLLHGMTDDASAWTRAGRSHVILDNLIARGEAVPMIVVNPLGYGFADPGKNLFTSMREPTAGKTNMETYAKTVVEEILPIVEKTYRVKDDRDARAVAGLSMGGAQAVYLGLNHPDRFGYVASFSGAFVMYGEDNAGYLSKLGQENGDGEIPAPHLLWLACGTEDFLIESHRKFEGWLKDQGVAFESQETPGAHTWMVWRRYLTELAPRLFRQPTD